MTERFRSEAEKQFLALKSFLQMDLDLGSRLCFDL